MSTHDEHRKRTVPDGGGADPPARGGRGEGDPFGPHQHHWADPVDRHESHTFLDDEANVGKLLWGFTALGAVLFLADLFFHRHIYHPWEELVGFYPLWGFAGIFLLVWGARLLRALVMRSEDYYEGRAPEEGPSGIASSTEGGS